MLTTTVTFEGNLAADPELRFTSTGKQLAELRVLVNPRRQNDAGEWEDTEPTRHRVTCFGTLAENVTESLRSGDRVIVVGRIATDSWTDKGQRRQAHRTPGARRRRWSQSALGDSPPHPAPTGSTTPTQPTTPAEARRWDRSRPRRQQPHPVRD